QEAEAPPDPAVAGLGLHARGEPVEDDDDDDADDADELPVTMPVIKDAEAKKFADNFKKKFPTHYAAIAEHCGSCHADDANSSKVPGGALGAGVSKDITPSWDAPRYAKAFAENEAALRQFGIDTPEKLKRSREGKEVFCGRDLPRQPAPGQPKIVFS